MILVTFLHGFFSLFRKRKNIPNPKTMFGGQVLSYKHGLNHQPMGEQKVASIKTLSDRKQFCKAVLNDVKALEVMLQEGLFEKGTQRIGAEQELCLIDKHYNPSMAGPEILPEIEAREYTSELARYNLEINLDPLLLEGRNFSNMQGQLERLLALGSKHAAQHEALILLTGILPTIRLTHLQPEYMFPAARYQMLSEELLRVRGEDFRIHLQGVDDLITSLDSVLFEACNTSFQLHLQIDPDDFVKQYNWAQAIAGPVLAIGTNSPMLLGRELWMETRIALFKQSLDTRSASNQLRDKASRVSFGNNWITQSAVEIFKDQVARFPFLLTREDTEDALQVLQAGQIPKLKALMLHNGTTYTWNRPCYGVANGIAHLRIECRYLPAGPTVLDEMANFAFWVGLMKGMPARFEKLATGWDFREARHNFIKAARTGMQTAIKWDGKLWSAPRLVNEIMLPIAEAGLQKAGIDASEINQYLGVIADRCTKNRSGSDWQVYNFRQLEKHHGRSTALAVMTRSMYEQQQSHKPVHEWDDIPANKVYPYPADSVTADKIMSTQLFTVREDDFIDLVASIMRWRNIRHMPVENDKGEVVGIVTATNLRIWKAQSGEPFEQVSSIMVPNPITVAPDTPFAEIEQLMRSYQIRCLPVVLKHKLVGIVTDTDVKRVRGGDG